MAHAETTAAHVKPEVSNVATKADTAAKTDVKRVDTVKMMLNALIRPLKTILNALYVR